ncbi:MAG: ABC transporter substrate-binding protein, partial [Dehalococcoidia bacterium]|nr:ABC transporter substrate-binding protein [Dehalococcoidia bacterium]
MKKRFGNIIGVCISLVLAVLVLASYAREASAVKGLKTIKVGLGMALTGPQPATTIPLSYGYLDHYRWVNEELGGIEVKGVKYKFDVRWEDQGYSPVRAISLFKRFKAAGVKYVQFIGSHPCEAISALALAERIPHIGANSNLSPIYLKTQPNYTITVLSPYVDGFAAGMAWIKGNWKETRKPRVGTIALDVSWGHELDRGYGAP